MHDPLGLHMLNTFCDLLEYNGNICLRQQLSLYLVLLDQLIQFLALAVLKQQVKITFVFKSMVQEYDRAFYVFVQFQMNVDLIFHSFLEILFLDLFLVYNFESELLIENLVPALYLINIGSSPSSQLAHYLIVR